MGQLVHGTMNSDKKHLLGEKIRDARIESGYSRAAFAEAIEVHPAHLSRLEHGKSSPRHVTLEKIAECTDRSITWFTESEKPVLSLEEDFSAEELAQLRDCAFEHGLTIEQAVRMAVSKAIKKCDVIQE